MTGYAQDGGILDRGPASAGGTKEQEFQNTTETGAPPKRRIATPTAAYNIYRKFRDEYMEGEAKRMAIVQGMIDGNPPYVQKELDEMGLGHCTNVNFMTMRANLDARAAAGHELFAEVPTLIECVPLARALGDPDVWHHCEIVAEEFTDMVTNWDGFLPAMDMIWRDSDAYGLGFGVFRDEWDWRIKAFHRGNLLLDPKASVEIDRNEIVLIRDEMSASEIYELLADEEVIRKRGWKPGAMKDLLVRTFIKGENVGNEDKFQRSTWESLQQMARNNDANFQEKQFERVRVVHFLVREATAPSKISHLIIPENCSQEPVFLYEGYGQYDKMSQAIWWLPYNYGDGYVRSVRGVASFMVQHDDLSNRFLCRVFDAGFMSSSLLLQPTTQLDMSRLQFMQHGPLTILPPDTKAVQSTFQPQIMPLIQLRGVSEQVMKNNTGTYRQHSEGVEGNEVQKTARQVIEETNKEARYEKAAIASRYVNLDHLYREMFRRVCNKTVLTGDHGVTYPGSEEARTFFKRCKERGVPSEFILKWSEKFRVSAYRAIGMGSLGVKYDVTNQLMNVRGSFDEAGQRAVLRDFVSARVGHRNTDKYVAKFNRDRVASNEMSIATLEFNDVKEGSPVVVGSDQLHTVHIGVFVQGMTEVMQMTEAGQIQDPVVAYRTMVLAMQHVRAHLQFLAQDPKRKPFVEQVLQFLQVAEQISRQLEQAAKRLMQAQQQQQQAQQQVVADAEQIKRDRETELRIFEAQKKFELDFMVKSSLNAMRERKTEESIRIARAKAEEEIRRKAEKQAAELQLQAQRTQAEIEMKRANQTG